MPPELGGLIAQLAQWSSEQATSAKTEMPLNEIVLGGRFAQAAYRMQLLPLLGDVQAQTLKGQTGELARSGWHTVLSTSVKLQDDPHVLAMSDGHLVLAEVADPIAGAQRKTEPQDDHEHP